MDTATRRTHRPTWDEHRLASEYWRPPPVAMTVVVPHPDDEALLFAGLIRLQRRRGLAVHVIAVTDGEAAYPDLDPAVLACRRRSEQASSLELLGVEEAAVSRLSIPDGRACEHEATIREAVERVGHTLVVAPWEHDHHTDHEACGRAALRGAARAGATVVAGMFWAWHRTPPQTLTERLHRLELDADTRACKSAAIRCHASQLVGNQPVVTPELLAPATWDSEYYVIARRADTPTVRSNR